MEGGHLLLPFRRGRKVEGHCILDPTAAAISSRMKLRATSGSERAVGSDPTVGQPSLVSASSSFIIQALSHHNGVGHGVKQEDYMKG